MTDEKFDYSKAKHAHPGKRFQGQFIDALISFIILGILIYFKNLAGLNNEIMGIVTIVIPVAYFILSDALPNGQSIGKRLLGMSVISKSTGKNCTIVQSILRNVFTPLLGIIDSILILTKKRQRLGDIMANTIVINIK